MKKIINAIPESGLVVAILIMILLAGIGTSCTKKTDVPKDMASIEFEVHEQSNVQSYTLEVSTNGHDFTDAGIHPSDDKLESKYRIDIDITRYNNIKDLFGRIKSIDKDKQTGYSSIFKIK